MDDFIVEPRGRGDKRAGVLVLHGGTGLGAHERQRAERLGELGYTVLAPDLFGVVFESRSHAVEVITKLVDRPAVLRGRVRDALERLRARPTVDASRCAAIGFCFGGLAALELARSGADVRCVVSFHGGLTTRAPARNREVHASVLICAGARDSFVTREHRTALEDEMNAAGADWQMHVHANALHGFTHGADYEERADRRSWDAMRSLFDEKLA